MPCNSLVDEVIDEAVELELVSVGGAGRTGIAWFRGWEPDGLATELWLGARKERGVWWWVDGGDGAGPGHPHPAVYRFPDVDRPPAPAPAEVEAVLAAFRSSDAVAIRALCGPTLRLADGCEGIVEQATAKQLQFDPLRVRRAGDRAVVDAVVRVNGLPADVVAIYLETAEPEAASGGWTLASVDESGPHAAAFLAGELPALARADAMAPSPALAEVFDGVTRGRVDAVPARARNEVASLLRRVEAPMTLVWAGTLPGTPYGAMCVEAAGAASVWAWRQEEDGWVLLDDRSAAPGCVVFDPVLFTRG
jgi:hypothetical protein